jgi:translation initiation factor 2 alpha subunit (eIF-2alpha)
MGPATSRLANEVAGSGSFQRKKDIIYSYISREDLFEKILRQTARDFGTSVKDCQSDIRRVLREQFDDVRATLDMVRNENAVTEGEQDPEFRDRVEAAVKAGKETLESIRSIVGTEES